jgi:hypothetical protein
MFRAVKTSNLYADEMNGTVADSIDPTSLKAFRPDTSLSTQSGAMPFEPATGETRCTRG